MSGSLIRRKSVKSQDHQIFFIPPYSQQLNPIELQFSKWNSVIMSGMSIFDENTLFSTIYTASTQIFVTDYGGWIRESTRFASTALQRKSFYSWDILNEKWCI
ncbi:hypothetical protein RF11_13180 [Thelohanellus kitauei]|uniref:Tc1-like transposase DDE domain-containing protein n=1 Tax=Thelohanellus kitauei TaxID=669202 RepID=A0A0C2JNI2_THEKT|nr:hypothetical protein RF11_13180 [Thelohanellus kitauei]